jgi:hypothetical protein
MGFSVFVSCVYEDKSYLSQLRDWAAKGRLGRDTIIVSEEKDVRQDGEAAIRGALNPKLAGASAVIVLVGSDTHDRRWVDYEVHHALSGHKQIVLVRIPGSSGAPPSEVRKLTILVFDPTAITAALGR